MARLRCKNCKKIISSREKGKKNLKLDYLPSKYCSWCEQHSPSRQSKISHREKKK